MSDTRYHQLVFCTSFQLGSIRGRMAASLVHEMASDDGSCACDDKQQQQQQQQHQQQQRGVKCAHGSRMLGGRPSLGLQKGDMKKRKRRCFQALEQQL